MVKGTNQIITMLQFYLYLFFAFYNLSCLGGGGCWGGPEICSGISPALRGSVSGEHVGQTGTLRACQTSQLPPGSHHNLVGRLPASSSNGRPPPLLLVFAKPTLCLDQVLARLLRCCLLQKSAAAFCQSSLRPDCRQAQCSPCDEEEDYHNDDGQDEDDHCWDPIVSRLNVSMMRMLKGFWVTLLLMMRRLFLLLLFIYQHY